MARKVSSKGKKPVLKSRKPVRRAKSQKYTSLMHGKRFRAKGKRGPGDDFVRDIRGRIKGTYIDGVFYPD